MVCSFLSEGGGHLRAYSQDLRDRILRALARGDRATQIARRFEVSREWGYDVKGRYDKAGWRHSLPMGGHRPSGVAPLESAIGGWIKEQPDLTLAEMCERLAEHGVTIKVAALWHELDKWHLSFKKNAARQRARTRGREGRRRCREGTSARA